MRKVGMVLLVLVIAAGAVFGFIRTGFFQKAIWVFQPAPAGLPGIGAARPDGPRGGAERPDAQRGEPPRGGELKGGWPQGERPTGQRLRGDGREGHGLNGGSAVSLGRAGWYALILAFFATVTILLERGVRLAKARRKR